VKQQLLKPAQYFCNPVSGYTQQESSEGLGVVYQQVDLFSRKLLMNVLQAKAMKTGH